MSDLKTAIRQQIPKHIRDNHELFSLFMEAYYEWLEKEENAYGFLRDFRTYYDLNKSLDEFVDNFKREFLQAIPDKMQADKRRLIQHIKDYYLTRGTEQGFNFLFKILFDEEVDITYPKESILRTSHGKWISNEQKIFITLANNLGDVSFKEITQTRIEASVLKTGKGTIKDMKIISNDKYKVAELVVTDIVGDFKSTDPVTIGGLYIENIYPVIDPITITLAGINYLPQESIDITQESLMYVTKDVPEDLIVDLGVTTFFNELDITVHINGVPKTPVTDFTFDGQNLSTPNAVEGQVIEVWMPSYIGDIDILSVGSGGEITELLVKAVPIGFSSLPSYTISTISGSGGTVNLPLSDSIFVAGKFKNTDGFLSADRYLQDSDFYQDYSYVIRTGISLENYADAVKKTIHPAGMKFFGNIYSVEKLRFEFRAFEDTFKVILPPFVTIYSGTEDLIKTLFVDPHLLNRGQHVDFLKHTHNEYSTPVSKIDTQSIDNIHADDHVRNNIVTDLDIVFKYGGSTVSETEPAAFSIYRTSDWVLGETIKTKEQSDVDVFILSF